MSLPVTRDRTGVLVRPAGDVPETEDGRDGPGGLSAADDRRSRARNSRGPAGPDGSAPGPGRKRGDRGQVAVEFTALIPAILAVVFLLWQAALIGYTFVLAGNAADRAVHAGAQADRWKDRNAECRMAGEEDLPAGWVSGADIGCHLSGNLVRAHADLKVPLLFPGLIDIPLTVTGKSAAARES